MLATGGIGKAYEVTSNSWEYSGDGQALAYEAGAELIDMEFVQFHPTGMVWPPGVRGLLVTEAVRGEGGILRNKPTASGSCGSTCPRTAAPSTPRPTRRPPAGSRPCPQGRETDARRPPELSTRDNVARAIYTEVKEGRGSPHGGVFLDISYLPADHVRRKLPSMYEQFKELADVDITTGPDGGRADDPLRDGRHPGRRRDRRDDGARAVRGGRGGAAGCTARTGWAATRCPTCSCSARGPARGGRRRRGRRPASRTSIRSRSRRPPRDLDAPLERERGEDPYAIQRDLQDDDAAPGRHLPGRGGPRRGARRSWPSCGARWTNGPR